MAGPRKAEKKTVHAGDEDFIYEVDAGKITLCNFSRAMSGAELRKHRSMDPLEILYYVLERDNDADEMEEIDKILDTIPGVEMGNLIAAWQEHARVTLGES